MGYWRIFRELFISVALAAFLFAIYMGLKLGYVFYSMPQGKGFIDSFTGGLMAAGMGYLIFLPVLFF